MKDYTKRPNVINFLPWWINYLKDHSKEEAFKCLDHGKTRFINRKDRLGLIQALNLKEK